MLLLLPLFVQLLASLCTAEYYHVTGDGFNHYIGNSNFHVEPYLEVSQYGIPPPPGGENSSAMYLTDLALYSETPHTLIPSTGPVNFHFTFFCGGYGSELEIRVSYPWQGDHIHLCGPKSDIEQHGMWVTATYTQECYSTCSALDIWFAGISSSEHSIVGLYSLSFTTDDSTFPPTGVTEPTTTTTPTTTTATTTTPTTTTPTTTTSTTFIPTTTTTTSSTITTTTTATTTTTTALPTTTTTTTPTTTTTLTTGAPIPGYWPNGKWGLPKSIRGCPDSKVSFATGSVEQDTEDNNEHDSSYMAGFVNKTKIKKEFCIKNAMSGGSGSWPAGDYCIYRVGGSCPPGFNKGTLKWDDRDQNDDNTFEGARPDGTWDADYTMVEYCCRSDGATSTYIELPTDDPFILISNTGLCQRVQDMKFHPQYIKYDTEDTDDGSQAWGDHPYIGTSNRGDITSSESWETAMDIQMNYCYYY